MSVLTPGPSGSPGGGPGQPPSNNQLIAVRVAVIGAILLALFAVVFFRLWYLQVLSGNSLAAEAVQNRQRSVAITAPRGEILDRNGRVLVRNRRALVVELSPKSLPESERQAAADYGKRLGEWYALSKAKRKQTPRPQPAPLQDPDLRQRYIRLGKVLGLNSNDVRQRVIRSLYLVPYANAQISKDVPSDVPPYLAERQDQFEGVSTSMRYVRRYPMGNVGAQLFGQVGPLSEDDRTNPKFRKLPENTTVGKGGLEYEYDNYLRGQDGQAKATINALGEIQGEVEQVPVTAGSNLQTTIDAKLEETAQAQLGGKWNPTGSPGAAIALDPRNGEVLAMASYPSFDANLFSRPVKQEEFDRLVSKANGAPIFNRALAGEYPAASTFKIVPAFAGTAEGKIGVDTIFQDTGSLKISDVQTRTNAGKVANGPVDMAKAIAVSSDTYFYQLGMDLNSKQEPLQRWARRFGFGKQTGIDLPGEAKGLIPDRGWRKQKAEDERDCRKKNGIPLSIDYPLAAADAKGCARSDMREWDVGDNVSLAIGQGDVSITPLQLATAYSAIENGGTVPVPHLAKATTDRTGGLTQNIKSPPGKKIELDSTTLAAVRDGIHMATAEGGGTSSDVFANWPQDKYRLYGKTGTGERDNQDVDQSWYVAYVPDPKRPIVVAVTVEKGGFGAQSAAPIAGEMLKSWFNLPDVELSVGESSAR